MFALEEMKRSFIYGNFMATVMLCQTFVEQTLGGMYSPAGRDDIARKGSRALIEQAVEDGYVPGPLAVKLHELRTMRNPYSHSNFSNYSSRLREAATYPEELVVQDAEAAIRILVDYIRHDSPGWNPTSHKDVEV